MLIMLTMMITITDTFRNQKELVNEAYTMLKRKMKGEPFGRPSVCIDCNIFLDGRFALQVYFFLFYYSDTYGGMDNELATESEAVDELGRRDISSSERESIG